MDRNTGLNAARHKMKNEIALSYTENSLGKVGIEIMVDKTIDLCYNNHRRKTARPGCTTIGANSGRAVFFCGFFRRE